MWASPRSDPPYKRITLWVTISLGVPHFSPCTPIPWLLGLRGPGERNLISLRALPFLESHDLVLEGTVLVGDNFFWTNSAMGELWGKPGNSHGKPVVMVWNWSNPFLEKKSLLRTSCYSSFWGLKWSHYIPNKSSGRRCFPGSPREPAERRLTRVQSHQGLTCTVSHHGEVTLTSAPWAALPPAPVNALCPWGSPKSHPSQIKPTSGLLPLP